MVAASRHELEIGVISIIIAAIGELALRRFLSP